MGLDWIPMRKPKPSFEDRFKQIFVLLEGDAEENEHELLQRMHKRRQRAQALVREVIRELEEHCEEHCIVESNVTYSETYHGGEYGEDTGKIIRLEDGPEYESPGIEIMRFGHEHEHLQENERELLLQELEEISENHHEAIKAPVIGRDTITNNYIKEIYQETDKTISEEEFMNKYEGCHVLELVKESAGIPLYLATVGGPTAFRGEFLECCEDLIGNDLLCLAWKSKLADKALDYVQQLMAIADEVASATNMLYLKKQDFIPSNPDRNHVSLAQKIHILYAAAKWLIFYGKNGHGFFADY